MDLTELTYITGKYFSVSLNLLYTLSFLEWSGLSQKDESYLFCLMYCELQGDWIFSVALMWPDTDRSVLNASTQKFLELPEQALNFKD